MYMGRNLMPRGYTPQRRLGDAFDDLTASIGNDFSDLSVPALSDGGSIISSSPSILPAADLSSLITTVPGLNVASDGSGSTALTQFNPATSDNSWQSLLTGVSKIAPAITNAYTASQTAAAQQALAKAQIAALPASTASTLTSLTSSAYFPYILLGGFALLAVSVLGGSSGAPARRR